MKPFTWLLVVVAPFVAAGRLAAQNYESSPSQAPDEATRKVIAQKTAQLGKQLDFMRRQSVREPALANVEIYHKAAVWVVRHNEFFTKTSAADTVRVLDAGLLRAGQLMAGESPWFQQAGQDVVRAYRSRVDGSVQPYAVCYPADYGKNPRQKWRIDVVLHGRDANLTEVRFLTQHDGSKPAPPDQSFIRIDIFGRVNNAYRWAGETDVFEALDNFLLTERLMGREPMLDLKRVVLRGFSMGGAGSWHLGLHYPSKWCVIGPGAGFTTTHGYIKGLPNPLPDYQEKCLRIYDAVDYAENAFDVPIVSYGGDKDPQLQASRNIEEKLKAMGLSMTLLVAPGLAHQFPPEWQKKAEAEYAKYAGPEKGRAEYPNKVRFVTYTLRYATCAWVELLGLNRHYEKARVEAEKTDPGFTVKTENVQCLRLQLPDFAVQVPLQVEIDGQTLKVMPYRGSAGPLNVYLERKAAGWQSVLPQKLLVDRLRRPRKEPGLQGPIDDAFMNGFLCVRGTGKAWHEAMQKHVEGELARFQQDWSKYLRGDLPIKDDDDLTEEDIASKHLILFGDPGSNSVLAQLLDRLPLQWNKDAIQFAGKSYPSAEHVPVLIYPNPLNAARYVVVNTGHTFHARDFRGTNALLYPRLGDYAVLKLAGGQTPETATAGLFNDLWRIEAP
jgi:predicted esterase